MENFELDLGLHSEIGRRVILREYPNRIDDFLQSFDYNQIECKKWLVRSLKDEMLKRNHMNKPLTIAVIGCWYANIIVPFLMNNLQPNYKISEIILVDKDEEALKISRKINQKYKNIKYRCLDANFDKIEFHVHIAINTSAEHMADTVNIKFKNNKIKFKNNKIVWAIQSNDLYDIREHVNCVSSEAELAIKNNIDVPWYKGRKALIGTGGKSYNRFMVIGEQEL